jgi:hypothetical protein
MLAWSWDREVACRQGTWCCAVLQFTGIPEEVLSQFLHYKQTESSFVSEQNGAKIQHTQWFICDLRRMPLERTWLEFADFMCGEKWAAHNKLTSHAKFDSECGLSWHERPTALPGPIGSQCHVAPWLVSIHIFSRRVMHGLQPCPETCSSFRASVYGAPMFVLTVCSRTMDEHLNTKHEQLRLSAASALQTC